MQAVQDQLSALAEKIQSLNLVLAMPELEAVERDVLSRALWDALDQEAELYNQLSSLSTPEPESAPEQATPEPEPVAVEDVQKESEAPAVEPVPTYVIEQVQTDIKQYTEQLEVFDKAIQTQAFAELPEDEQARRLRSRGHLADYLEEAKEELESFGPLFDELNVIEPAEELEQELERQNEIGSCDCNHGLHESDRIECPYNSISSDLASDFDVLFSAEPEPESTQVVSVADELADLQAKVSQAKALAEKNTQLQAEKAVIESELSDLERQLEQIFAGGYNEFADIEAAKIQREIEVRQRCKREIMAHFESPESIVPAWAKWQDRIDELTPSPEPEVLEPEPVNPKPAVKQKLKKAIVKILKTSDPRRANIEQLNSALNSDPWLFDAQADFIQDQLDELLSEGLIESVESNSGTVWFLPALPAPRKPKAPPEKWVPSWHREEKPAVKTVKVDQIGTVTPTPEQLRDAVLEILGREPGFASREMLDLSLPGAPWLFDVNTPNTREMLTGVLSGLMDNGVIEFFSTENGLFLRLATLSTPSEPQPVKADLIATLPVPSLNQRLEIVLKSPACIYCGTHMQPINGNDTQWRCLGNIYHSFYVSNGRGVWVDNSGTFDKQITDVPSWARKEG